MSEAATKAQTGIERKILVVEGETEAREIIRRSLEREGFSVEETIESERAIERIRRRPPDLLVLDLILPGTSGLEICRRLRSAPATAGLPILAVSAMGSEVDRVIGLEMGADDYLVKPLSPRELVARVRALLRRCELRTERDAADSYQRGRLMIDFGTREVFVDTKRRELTPREFELLQFLAKHPKRAYSRKDLLNSVWGRHTFVGSRTVDVHIRRLRRHIERDDSNPEIILSVRRVGYRFNPEALG